MSSSFLPRRAIIMGRHRRPETAPSPQSAHPGAQPSTTPAWTAAPALENDSLEKIITELLSPPEGCSRCKLCQSRKTIVVGEGNPNAELVFVGEGPAEQEDAQGRPFVGKAGQLLDKMIHAMGLQREQVYLCNIVKCHPTGNRNPEAEEIEACSQFLARQLDVIRPKIVVALGNLAAQTLLQTEEPISQLRGNFFPYRNGAKLMPTLHPAHLLRNPVSKREAWADLQQVASELGLQIPKRG